MVGDLQVWFLRCETCGAERVGLMRGGTWIEPTPPGCMVAFDLETGTELPWALMHMHDNGPVGTMVVSYEGN